VFAVLDYNNLLNQPKFDFYIAIHSLTELKQNSKTRKYSKNAQGS
jgi:hypothetical protein